MKVRELKSINILNYNDNIVVVSTKNDGYAMQPASNGNPSILPLTFDEISYINSNSEIFKTGLLRFPEDLQEDIYEELKISGWKNILTNEDIKDIILNPSIDGLTKIISIKNIANFERVKGVFTSLKNENAHDISMRVEDILKARDAELRKGIRNSAIIIQAKDAQKMIAVDEVNQLKDQNKLLQEQMLNMQKMMEQMMAMQNSSASSESKEEIEKPDVETKKAGRPSTKK